MPRRYEVGYKRCNRTSANEKKAPGVDQVKTEMLKIDTELSTELLLELWRYAEQCLDPGLRHSWCRYTRRVNEITLVTTGRFRF